MNIVIPVNEIGIYRILFIMTTSITLLTISDNICEVYCVLFENRIKHI